MLATEFYHLFLSRGEGEKIMGEVVRLKIQNARGKSVDVLSILPRADPFISHHISRHIMKSLSFSTITSVLHSLKKKKGQNIHTVTENTTNC